MSACDPTRTSYLITIHACSMEPRLISANALTSFSSKNELCGVAKRARRTGICPHQFAHCSFGLLLDRGVQCGCRDTGQRIPSRLKVRELKGCRHCFASSVEPGGLELR